MADADRAASAAVTAEGSGSDRVAELEERNASLRAEKRKAASETRYLRDEVANLTKEVQRLTVELEKIKHPPLIVGMVLDVLDDGRLIIKSSTGPNFVVPVADFVDRKELAVGSRVSLNQSNLTVVGLLPASRDPVVAAAEVVERPAEGYDAVAGLDDVIQEVREMVEYPLTQPERFAALGIKPPKGVLLTGLPGTGKTLLARAAAHATNATYIRLVGSELVQKFIGEGARRVRDVFKLAREKAPSIIFIDEIDAIAARRVDDGNTSNREVERTLMQLLAELDGFSDRGDVRLLAATNRADILDPAILRPGRFDRVIQVPLPSPEGLRAILHLHTRGMSLAGDVDLDAVAAALDAEGGGTGADVRSVCTEAGMIALRAERTTIGQDDLLRAVARLGRGELATGATGPATAGLYA
ncbi:MAG: proteasome-activating nucleotidase [Thermoplasmatota archaeon]